MNLMWQGRAHHDITAKLMNGLAFRHSGLIAEHEVSGCLAEEMSTQYRVIETVL